MKSRRLMLQTREYGVPEGPAVMLLHGLFGSATNWQGVVKRLQDDYRLILPDLRNHGRSPHHNEMDYPVMADDLFALLDRLQLDSASLVGHSLGGKVAMWLALSRPERVDRLVVADIAPVAYANRFEQIIQGLQALPLESLQSRGSADQRLARWVPSGPVRQYLLQNLIKRPGGWRWRFNLPVLSRSLEGLAGFPAVERLSFAGDTLFLYGERSDYLRPEHREIIDRLFPHARLRMLPGAGHWLYAEQPEAFARMVKGFLGSA